MVYGLFLFTFSNVLKTCFNNTHLLIYYQDNLETVEEEDYEDEETSKENTTTSKMLISNKTQPMFQKAKFSRRSSKGMSM